MVRDSLVIGFCGDYYNPQWAYPRNSSYLVSTASCCCSCYLGVNFENLESGAEWHWVTKDYSVSRLKWFWLEKAYGESIAHQRWWEEIVLLKAKAQCCVRTLRGSKWVVALFVWRRLVEKGLFWSRLLRLLSLLIGSFRWCQGEKFPPYLWLTLKKCCLLYTFVIAHFLSSIGSCKTLFPNLHYVLGDCKIDGFGFLSPSKVLSFTSLHGWKFEI